MGRRSRSRSRSHRSKGQAASSSSSGAAVSGSTREMLQKTAGTELIEGTPNHNPITDARTSSRSEHPGKGGAAGNPDQAVRDSSGGVQKVHPGKGAADTVSSGEMLDKKAAAASSGGAPTARHGKVVANAFPKTWQIAKASSGGMPTTLLGTEAVGAGLSDEMPQKNAAALNGDSPSVGAFDGNTPAQDCDKMIPQKHCPEDKADMGLSVGMPQKHSSKVEADSSLSEEILHEHTANAAYAAKDIQESDSNEIAHVNEEDAEIKEAELLIKELNELCIGEPFSEQEFLHYFDNLACEPPWIDLKVRVKREELVEQYSRHALYRLRYYKHKLKQASKEELSDDKLKSILDISEDDCNEEFLKKENFFSRFQEDKRLDWFFHPDYLRCSLLDDYQRLVPKNHGYNKWSEYHAYLHSYEMEREYVRYCEELSKQLKWMEPYVDMDRQSIKWGKISSRGVLQAIKIAATSFHKITSCLAFTGYYECKESMTYDIFWFKEYDGVYFEIWRRVNKGMSFKKALGEVYNLNMFPLRQHMMKAALEHEEGMMMVEDEFRTCTAAITPEVKEDKAKELIADAVHKRVQKPKSYEEYIIKKIHIARVIGILDADED